MKKAVILALALSILCAGHVLAAPSAISEQGETSGMEPVTLEKTVNATLRNHRALKVIQENRQAAIHELRRAKAGWGPQIDLSGRGGFGYLSDDTTRSEGSDTGMYASYSAGALLVQPLWDGLATHSRVWTREAMVDSLTHRVFDNATTLSLDGLIAHIDLLRRREILRLAEENVRQYQMILAAEKERVALGAAASSDVSQTQGRLARAMTTLTEARASLREGEASYSRLTGLPVPEELASIVLPADMYVNADEVMRDAERWNPKLNAYLADIQMARGDKELAKSAFHPQIRLEAGPNFSDREGPGSHWSKGNDVMLVMRWNLFKSGADVAATRSADAKIDEASEILYNFKDELAEEVENTWTQYRSAIAQQKYYEEAVIFNRETRDAYREQFLLGQRSLLDVLDAEDELFNSSTQYETMSGNVLVGAYRMYGLSGRLLSLVGADISNLNDPPAEELPVDVR